MGESRATFVAKRLRGHRGLKIGASTALVEHLVEETIRLWAQSAICGYCGGPHIDGRDHEEERRIWFGDQYSDDKER